MLYLKSLVSNSILFEKSKVIRYLITDLFLSIIVPKIKLSISLPMWQRYT